MEKIKVFLYKWGDKVAYSIVFICFSGYFLNKLNGINFLKIILDANIIVIILGIIFLPFFYLIKVIFFNNLKKEIAIALGAITLTCFIFLAQNTLNQVDRHDGEVDLQNSLSAVSAKNCVFATSTVVNLNKDINSNTLTSFNTDILENNLIPYNQFFNDFNKTIQGIIEMQSANDLISDIKEIDRNFIYTKDLIVQNKISQEKVKENNDLISRMTKIYNILDCKKYNIKLSNK